MRLPYDPWLTGLPTPAVLELRCAGDSEGKLFAKPWHVALGALPSTVPGTLQIPLLLAQSLSLPPSMRVTIRALSGIPRALSVSVQPLDADDWEAASLCAADVEQHMLSQSLLAETGGILPFYPPAGGPPVRLRVQGGTPAGHSLLLLGSSTELHVAPVLRDSSERTEAQSDALGTYNDDDDDGSEGWEEDVNGVAGEEEEEEEDPVWSADVRILSLPPAALARAPAPHLASFLHPKPSPSYPAVKLAEASHVALAQSELLKAAGCPEGGIVRLSLLSGGVTHDAEDAGGPPPPQRLPGGLLVRLAPLRAGVLPVGGTAPPSVFSPKLVREQLAAPPFARLRLQRLSELDRADVPRPRRITLHPLSKGKKDAAPPPPPAFGARLGLPNAAAGLLEASHRAALMGCGWDGSLSAPPPSDPSAAASNGGWASLLGGGATSSTPNSEAEGESVDASSAARRLFAAWVEAQGPAPEGVPLADGSLLIFEATAPRDPWMLMRYTEEEAEGEAPKLRACFVLRCEPAEALLPPPRPRAALSARAPSRLSRPAHAAPV